MRNCLAEANSDVEYRPDGLPAVSLCVTAASSPVRLVKHEVFTGHHPGRRIQPQRLSHLITECKVFL